MNLDAELMFECLIYLNTFYYPVFATCESIMAAAKYKSIIPTPYIDRDAGVVVTRLTAELLKILLFRKFKDERRNLATGIGVFFTAVSVFGLLYTFFVQSPVLKLEYILCSLSIMLATTELFFGTLQLLPCFQKVQYN